VLKGVGEGGSGEGGCVDFSPRHQGSVRRFCLRNYLDIIFELIFAISTKYQAPNSKQIPMTKTQIFNWFHFGHLDLELIWNLEFETTKSNGLRLQRSDLKETYGSF
jgi:hypothetical protein